VSQEKLAEAVALEPDSTPSKYHSTLVTPTLSVLLTVMPTVPETVLLLGGTAMLGLGIYDDVKGIAPWQKLFFQLLIAVGLYFGGFQIVRLSNPFGDLWELGWLSLPVSVLWIVGLTNAINLLDGIDGLVTGITACISLALALMNIMGNNTMVALLTLCLAGACLGFLPYNFSPARIFLGDSGSLFIGLILA